MVETVKRKNAKKKAFLAGGIVLALGATLTLAAWTGSVNFGVRGSIRGAELEMSLDGGNTWQSLSGEFALNTEFGGRSVTLAPPYTQRLYNVQAVQVRVPAGVSPVTSNVQSQFLSGVQTQGTVQELEGSNKTGALVTASRFFNVAVGFSESAIESEHCALRIPSDGQGAVEFPSGSPIVSDISDSTFMSVAGATSNGPERSVPSPATAGQPGSAVTYCVYTSFAGAASVGNNLGVSRAEHGTEELSSRVTLRFDGESGTTP